LAALLLYLGRQVWPHVYRGGIPDQPRRIVLAEVLEVVPHHTGLEVWHRRLDQWAGPGEQSAPYCTLNEYVTVDSPLQSPARHLVQVGCEETVALWCGLRTRVGPKLNPVGQHDLPGFVADCHVAQQATALEDAR